jgi:hypothetical protein
MFADGERMVASAIPAWCRTCEAITVVEDLPPIALLSEHLARLKNGNVSDEERELAKMFERTLEQFRQERIATWTEIIARFQHRTSPNRCINCGGFDFEPLHRERMPDTFAHPGCSGQFARSDTFHAIPATYFLLDAEGYRLNANQVRAANDTD